MPGIDTYSTRGAREDLSDVIYRIAPTETPFMSAIGKTEATNTLHEWQEQDLAAAGQNAAIEGADATNTTTTATVRARNWTQISTKTVQVTGTNEATRKAGRKSEMAYQMSLKSLELKRDMEFILMVNGSTGNGSAQGTAAAARKTIGVEGWIKDNNNMGASGVAPDPYATGAAPLGGTDVVDGTARTLTETMVKDVLMKCWTQGGNPDTIMVGGLQKQNFSTFSGNATRMDKSEDKTLYASIDVYESDFGTLKIVPNRFMRARSMFCLQTDKWAVAYLRPFATTDLAKAGDSVRKQIVVEYALESRNQRASGAVRDLA